MVQVWEGNQDGSGLRIGIVCARFNSVVCEKLLEGAQTALKEAGVADDDIAVARVPGAFELPAAALQLLEHFTPDAVICLGAVVRGETPHFDYVCDVAARGVGDLSLETGTPILFGVLTTDTMDQALARAGGDAGNKGVDAALAAIEMVRLYEKMPSPAEDSASLELDA